jgi:plasmid stabilization system protein ParE
LILKKIFDPSIIFYFVDDASQTVFIIRVLRHERNWQKILGEELSYTFD